VTGSTTSSWGIGNVIKAPIDLLRALSHALGDLFQRNFPGGIFRPTRVEFLALTPFQRIHQIVSTAWERSSTIRSVVRDTWSAERYSSDCKCDLAIRSCSGSGFRKHQLRGCLCCYQNRSVCWARSDVQAVPG
jgi:hypothetical protein